MPQQTSHAPKTWDAPNIQALVNDLIYRPGYVTLRILGRIDYANGNVVLLCGTNAPESGLYQNYLLSADGVVIAEPKLHYGDILTSRGTYFAFDCALASGVTIQRLEVFTNCRLRVWDVLLNGSTTGDTIWETETGCRCNRSNYRSVYQAANVSAEEWAIRQADPELEAVF